MTKRYIYSIYIYIMKTILELPQDLIELLSRVCKHKQISKAEAIRTAVRVYWGADAPTDSAFGLWKNRKIDGMAYQRKLRSEWE